MGAWGAGSFENDDASDWIYSLEEATGEEFLAKALALIAVKEEEAYVEAPECQNAIGAAEVVAALKGNPADTLPKEVLDWVLGKPKPSAQLLRLAGKAIERIKRNSELLELWEESDRFEDWLSNLGEIERRLI